MQRKTATAGSHFQPSRTSHVQRESSPDDFYFQPFSPHRQENYKVNRLPAVPISNLLEKITVPRTVIFLEAIYIGIDFLDVFVIIEGVVEFFKGC